MTSEYQIHCQVADFLRVALKDDVFWTSLEHQNASKVMGARNKAKGVRAGLPDIMLMEYWHSVTATTQLCLIMFIELKTPKGRLSPAQKTCHEALRDAGAEVHVCRSLAEVQTLLSLRGWLKESVRLEAA